MKKRTPDFSGWATKNDLKCSDGRIIVQDAFKHCDGVKVPLVWNHQHSDPSNILGHAILQNRKEGVYTYGYFNDGVLAEDVKVSVKHGDITNLSIYANRLKQDGPNVLHGDIREVSLVLAGANPGARIESVLLHGDSYDDNCAVIYTGETISLTHSETKSVEADAKAIKQVEEEKGNGEDMKDPANKKMVNKDDTEKTVAEVFDTLTDEQKEVVYYLIGTIANEQEEDMKQNAFYNDEIGMDGDNVLTHSDVEDILSDAKRSGSLRESFLAHAATYGIDNIEYLFPDAKNVLDTPDFIKRKTDWVSAVIDQAHHTPFSRIKSTHADITADAARAKGYMKGNLKKEEVFTLLKRSTNPTTIYKKQKLDRDDQIDITDLDVVAFIKAEMRVMLDEEIARAALTGDGRLSDDDDKISTSNIRPIWTDSELYAIHKKLDTTDASDFIDGVIVAMEDYEGSGDPVLFAPQNIITKCLLLKDTLGHRIYKTIPELATALQVSSIVAVPVMKNLTRTVDGEDLGLDAIIVNMKDYAFGADKGGSVNLFEDFDIDYNQQKYLIETRCSGALIKPKSAVVVEHVISAAE